MRQNWLVAVVGAVVASVAVGAVYGLRPRSQRAQINRHFQAIMRREFQFGLDPHRLEYAQFYEREET